MTDISIQGTETIEEVYFLVRTGVWHPEHLAEYLEMQKTDVYDTAYSDGMEYARDTATETDWQRGHEQGYNEGYDQGSREAYRDGYADGSRENYYDNRR
jgi:flagellar biosynthesis/type III secretory pathway protein FliH